MELLSAAGIGTWLGACGNESETTPEGAKKVLVLGGGLAGLTAAYELMKTGHDVTVLEGQSKVGGRVSTYHEGFQGGQHVEEGAVRIPDVHEHTVDYCNDLGLELVEFESGDPLYYLNGQSFQHVEGMDWPLAGLVGDEKQLGLDKYDDYIYKFFEEFGNYREGGFPKPDAVTKYNKLTWADFIKGNGASDAWLKLYTADNGTEISKIGALIWMATEVADYNWDKTFRIEGGNDLLPKALAAKLGDKVLMDRKVTKIEHTDKGVTVHFDNNGVSESLSADHLVCALPFTTLRKIEISPALPADKTSIIKDLFMMTSSRGFFQTETRFWKDQGIGGIKLVKTDTPAERIWDLSNGQKGDNGMLMAYMQHENAVSFDNQGESKRRAYLEGVFDGFFPGFKDKVIGYHQKSWALDPWVEAAWTDLLPNQWDQFAIIGRAEGRIHFAGEHTSIWAGWMQGAIESGKRAAAEIGPAA